MSPTGRTAATWLLTACGIWLIGLGFYFIVLRPPLLPEDPRFMGSTVEQLRVAAPGLEAWLKHVFRVMGGFMAGAGVLTVFVALCHVAAQPRAAAWSIGAIGLTGALTVGLMSATNFALHSDFRWLLLVPALLWLATLAIFFASRAGLAVPVAPTGTASAGVD